MKIFEGGTANNTFNYQHFKSKEKFDFFHILCYNIYRK